MGENSKIEWCHHTFNPWVGCQKISPACDHCYAESWAKRSGHPELWQGDRRRTRPSNWSEPLKWNAQAQLDSTRPRVFCSSLADVFDNAVDPQWRADLFDLIGRTPNLSWLLLTKRIGNAHAMIDESMDRLGMLGWAELPPWPHVWIGATIANQEEADRDILKLQSTPAAIRFLSIEPMLGPVDLRRAGAIRDIFWDTGVPGGRAPVAGSVDWVIAGGESGPHARPSHPEWFRSLKQQCSSARVKFFMKQMGGTRDKRDALESIPEDLRAREWPDAP